MVKKKKQGFSTAYPFGKPPTNPLIEALKPKTQGFSTAGLSSIAPKPEATPEGFMYHEEGTGKPSGIQTDKALYLGDPRDIGQIAQSKYGASAEQLAKEQEMRELAEKIGKTGIGSLTPEEVRALRTQQGMQDISYEQARRVGMLGAAGGFITGATGAGIAAVATGGGALPFAPWIIATATASGGSAAYAANIKIQMKDNIKAEKFSLTDGKAGLIKTVTLARAGSPDKAVELFNAQLSDIQTAHNNLKLNTDSDMNLYAGEDGVPVLSKYKVFERNTLPIIAAELELAVTGQPSAIGEEALNNMLLEAEAGEKEGEEE